MTSSKAEGCQARTNESLEIHDSDAESIITIAEDKTRPELVLYPSHVSHTHDAPMVQYTSQIEIPDEIYNSLSPSRKRIIVALLAFCAFLAPISSTTVLAAIPEVADTYHTTGTIINLSNAIYLVSTCMLSA